MKRGSNRQGDYWSQFFTRAITYVVLFAFIVTVIGVLAVPVIMSVMYSWMWMFLYPGYLILILLAVAYARR